jgi:hypothetical protein
MGSHERNIQLKQKLKWLNTYYIYLTVPDYGGQRLLFSYSQCRIEGNFRGLRWWGGLYI